MRLSPPLACALVAALLLAVPALAIACTCTGGATLQQEFDAAARVFSGRVLSVTPSVSGDFNEVRFEPIERWKGPLDHEIVVLTGTSDGDCGIRFDVGGEYLLFTWIISYGVELSPTPFAHSCSRTGPLTGNPWISLLPPPVLPVPAVRPSWGALKLAYR